MLVASLWTVSFPMGNGPARIIIVRHAEKPASRQPHLALRGRMRAIGLSKLLPKIVKPDFVFASTSTRHSARPYQTIRFTADKMGLSVSTSYADKETKKLVRELRKKEFEGKTILMCWHHGMMPRLIRELGHESPYEPWPEDLYDRIICIDGEGIKNLPQRLLFGDTLD
jgi:broad specificity phosphatase PhoE